MTDIVFKFRHAAPHLVEDVAGIAAIFVIFLGGAHVLALI